MAAEFGLRQGPHFRRVVKSAGSSASGLGVIFDNGLLELLLGAGAKALLIIRDVILNQAKLEYPPINPLLFSVR